MHTEIWVPSSARLGPSYWTRDAELSKAVGTLSKIAVEYPMKLMCLRKLTIQS